MNKNNRKTEMLIALASVVPVIVLGFWRLRFGFDLSDEGLYLTSPLRYLLGDIPFRDEVHNVVRCFDILLWPVMRLLPGAGSVLAFRYIGFLLHVSGVLFLYASLRKHVDAIILYTAFAAVIFTNVYHIWTPGYHSMPVAFICISLGALARGILAGDAGAKKWWGICAGLGLFFAAFCFFPLFAMAGISAVYAIYLRAAKKDCAVFAWFTLSAAAPAVCAAAVIYLCGLGPDALEAVAEVGTLYAIKTQGASGSFEVKFFSNFDIFVQTLIQSIPDMAIIVVVFLPVVFNKMSEKNYLISIIWSAGAAAFYGLYLHGRSYMLICTALSVVAFVSGIILYCAGGAKGNKTGVRRTAPVFVFAVLCWVITSYFSNADWRIGANLLPALFFFAVAAGNSVLRGTLPEGERRGISTAAKAAFICLFMAIGINMTWGDFRWSYRDAELVSLDTEFSYSRAKGVHSTKERVEMVEELLAFMEGRVGEGDRLLAFNKIPMIHYLTGTLPALETSWVTDDWPVDVRKKMVGRMIEKGRVPKYAVRALYPPESIATGINSAPVYYSIHESNDPVFAFVNSRYEMIKKIGIFEVWENKTGNASPENER